MNPQESARMTTHASPDVSDRSMQARAATLFAENEHELHRRTDRLFAALMLVQWVASIGFAVWVSPYTWEGPVSRTHLHVWAAIVVGGAISVFPALLGLLRPGHTSTRYTIATAQMLMGALLIHLSGGRIETHFHVFGSLAFLAFYRDWRVLVPATIVVAADHFLRGLFWPESVYGVVVASQWRWLEHAGWVIFEDSILVVACRRSVVEMWQSAERTAALEETRDAQRRNAEQLHTLVDQLRITQRQAEAATRAKSDFLASMSHELRTPLNAIILYSELLQEEAQDKGHEESIADLERIQSAGKHLMALINDILDLSKIEAGKMALSIEPFSVRDMFDELFDTIGPVVQKKGNVLTLRCPDDIGTMTGDQMKTRQILLNLLGNAGKFTHDGTVTLEVSAIVLRSVESIEFIVTDTGVGMTTAQTERIFDAFTQADVTTTRKYGGTGLGLAIVSRFCALMGGSIAVESEPGAGSRFIVVLPRVVAEPAHEKAASDEPVAVGMA
jgi:two-component system, sensor histidine kinase and response regulator